MTSLHLVVCHNEVETYYEVYFVYNVEALNNIENNV